MKNNRNKKGITLVEYSLALGAVASAAIFAFSSLGANASEVVEDLTSALTVDGQQVNEAGAGGEPVKFVNYNPLVKNGGVQ